MKKMNFFQVAGLFAMSLFLSGTMLSCGESEKERAQRETIDSLEMVNDQSRMSYADLQEYITVIAEGLDSITAEEQQIVLDATPGEGKTPSRQQIKQKLDHAREVLNRHRERIAELEKKLGDSEGDAKKLRTIILALKEQVAQKDYELAQLRAELDNSNKSIADLRNTVVQMKEVQDIQQNTIGEQQQTIDQQQNTIQQQDEQINTGYIRTGTSKELKNAGLLTGGFLKKKKVDYSNIDLNQFDRIDIRTTKRITLPRKSKIMTSVPEGSYTLENTDGGMVLTITDPARFWSVSNFLIIQTN